MKSPVNEDRFYSEVSAGERFGFGKNWNSFIETLTEERIAIARISLKEVLGLEDSEFHNKSFLDVGSGSGLFSLAARQMGAKVCSFDYDPYSVTCTKFLRSNYFPDDVSWEVYEGSVLSRTFLKSLGTFDIVYAFGVLHHTGDLWSALENVVPLIRRDGLLHVAVYNDQGLRSNLWRVVKQVYCSGNLGKSVICSVFFPYFFLRTCMASLLKGRNAFAKYKRNRGMSIVHDWHDWLGGLPYEVASIEEVTDCITSLGHRLKWLRTTNGNGNNQFTFVREVGEE